MALDDIVPDWDKRERHRLAVAAPAAAVIQAARELTWGEVPSFRRMMLIAAFGRVKFPAGGPVLDMFLSNGFEVLHHSDQELVIGGVERTLVRHPRGQWDDPPYLAARHPAASNAVWPLTARSPVGRW